MFRHQFFLLTISLEKRLCWSLLRCEMQLLYLIYSCNILCNGQMKVNTHQQEGMLSQKQTFQIELNVFGVKEYILTYLFEPK